ncbi:MAG: type II secretion system F family protein [Lachnospiraceae bacterium]|nr:type II secretion system F family protein [Lachnospiraceae bacterium]
MPDYKNYQFSKRESIWYMLFGMAGAFAVFYLFYQSVIFCLPLSVAGGVGILFYMKRNLAKKQQWNLMVEFKDAMDSLVSALAAGYSMENAISEAYRDLQLMYGRETPMLLELKNMEQRIRLKHPLDELLLDMGRRSGLEDILTFAQIYATARKSGGNLVRVMKRTADNIGEKMEMQREIQTMIAGKKMESICMMIIPLCIILYLQLFSPGFLDPLYSRLEGRLFMTGALVIYGAAVFWSHHIMKF